MYAYLGSLEIDEDMMVIMDGVCIGIGITSPTLEVLSTDKAAVYVDI